VHTYVIHFLVSPSIIDVNATLDTPNENRTLHTIIVTCTIDPDSTANQCVVMAMADGQVTRTGNQLRMYD